MIEVKGIHKSFGKLEVLKGIHLSIAKGAVVSIVGASGAGKSTLLHIMGTIDRAERGEVIIENRNVLKLKDKQLAEFRNKKIGFVFQFHHLLPEFDALENVCIPAFIAGESKKSAEKRALELLDFMGLSERINHKPGELSGGEQQRVAIARALINNPVVVLMDEPSGNLDSKASKTLHQLFFDLRDQFGQTFVIVTHNKELAEMTDKTFTIKDGIIS